ncbi:hypothetical protein [Streptomyces rubrogriseus]
MSRPSVVLSRASAASTTVVGALRAARLTDSDFHAVRGGNAAALLRKD